MRFTRRTKSKAQKINGVRCYECGRVSREGQLVIWGQQEIRDGFYRGWGINKEGKSKHIGISTGIPHPIVAFHGSCLVRLADKAKAQALELNDWEDVVQERLERLIDG